MVGEVEQPLVVVVGLLVPTLYPVDRAEAGQRGLLAVAAAGSLGEPQRLLKVVGGRSVQALPPVHDAEADQRLQFAVVVAGGPGQAQRPPEMVGGPLVPAVKPVKSTSRARLRSKRSRKNAAAKLESPAPKA